MVLNKDFKEFIELLNAHEVKYLVVGGYAVAYHGYPRYTKDLDFWIWMDHTNAQQVLSALKAFGFASLGLTIEDFLVADNVIQLGYPPNRIDLLTYLEGVPFETAYNRKERVDLEGTIVDFINVEDLITVKQQAGRLQDLADVEELNKKTNNGK